jgi:hypothetical protein
MDFSNGAILVMSVANLVLILRLSFQAGRFTERVDAHEKRLDTLERDGGRWGNR